MTTTEQTITHIFDSMTEDDRWCGFGYLGGRRNALDSTDAECPVQPEMVAAADKRVLDFANENGWTREQLFAWANSKDGRHFADAIFGGTGRFDERFAMALRWNVLRVQR